MGGVLDVDGTMTISGGVLRVGGGIVDVDLYGLLSVESGSILLEGGVLSGAVEARVASVIDIPPGSTITGQLVAASGAHELVGDVPAGLSLVLSGDADDVIANAEDELSCSGEIVLRGQFAPVLTLGGPLHVQPEGAVRGVGSIHPGAAALTNAGLIAPGEPLGVLSISGDYHQSGAGTLEIDLASTGADRLDVAGSAQLAGALAIAFPPGAEPSEGQTFTVLTAASVSGAFDAITAPGSLDVDYQPSAVVVTVGPGAVPGDVSGDGVVDVVDLLALLGQWGPCGEPCAADFDGDGDVDIEDLLFLLGAWTA
jgi:hypothetical protein